MTTARSHLIDQSRTGCYHVVSRCVRRGYLCGDQWEHRREWIERAICDQAAIFAVEILAYAVMSNHFHLVMKVKPEIVQGWSAREVAERWCLLFPLKDRDGVPLPPDPRFLDAKTADDAWIAERRSRLGSLSWFMKLMKERIARRANVDDGCTGHFWEGRFTSVALLDQAAVIACMAYVDLNPVRAAMADRPETSERTSVRERIEHRQAMRARDQLAKAEGDGSSAIVSTLPPTPWLAPLRACVSWSDETARLCPCPISSDDYLELVDQTGRIVRKGKRGAIPSHLAPILERLDVDLERWLAAMANGGRFGGSAIGCAWARAKEAVRRGVKWIVDRTLLHRDDGEGMPAT
ncbi:MAG: transposase [Planctomycetes bacterium]|nr:transposase [Planctomycetota bacterium]